MLYPSQKTIHRNLQGDELPRRWQLLAVSCALFFSIVVVGAGNVPVDKTVLAPGTVESLASRVSVVPTTVEQTASGRTRSRDSFSDRPGQGDIRLVTVRTWRATLADLAYAAIRSDVEVFDDPTISEPEPQRQKRRSSELASSEVVAQFVASRAAGIPVTPTGSGALVEDVTTDASKKALVPGDVITEVAGLPVRVADDIRGSLDGKSPGQVVQVRLIRGSDSITTEVTLTASSEHPHRALLGVIVSTADLHLASPLKVEYRLTGIGGPSAGLALALELYCRFTGRDLTGPSIVVATGELQLDGKVLPVGGVAQKARAAVSAGADILVVPAANAEEARSYAGDVVVLGVNSFAEAVSVLLALANSAQTVS
ncbi:MAG: hypothetical protein C4318_06260 [Acidimicrobiia bacterium]